MSAEESRRAAVTAARTRARPVEQRRWQQAVRDHAERNMAAWRALGGDLDAGEAGDADEDDEAWAAALTAWPTSPKHGVSPRGRDRGSSAASPRR